VNPTAVTKAAMTYSQYQRTPTRRPSSTMKTEAALAVTSRSTDSELVAGFANHAATRLPCECRTPWTLNHAVPSNPIAARLR